MLYYIYINLNYKWHCQLFSYLLLIKLGITINYYLTENEEQTLTESECSESDSVSVTNLLLLVLGVLLWFVWIGSSKTSDRKLSRRLLKTLTKQDTEFLIIFGREFKDERL